MGMFDYIEYECKCPKCGEKVTGFQSKDRNCDMDILSPTQVDHFYSICDRCKEWISFDAVNPTSSRDYKRNDGKIVTIKSTENDKWRNNE